MDQLKKQFVPYAMVVQTGTPVLFANSDSIAHQVYSFSPARQFELGLYRGRPRDPVVFDKAGVVVLGCNIHDNMVGYIYVTDSPWFGKTDERGRWDASGLPSGSYAVQIWSPRFSSGESQLRQNAQVGTERSVLTFHLRQSLQAEPAPVAEPRLRDY